MENILFEGAVLRNKRRFFGSKWKNQHFVLTSDSRLSWYKFKGQKKASGSILLKCVVPYICIGQMIDKMPVKPPSLPEGLSIDNLMAIGMDREATKVHWLLFHDETLDVWLSEIIKAVCNLELETFTSSTVPVRERFGQVTGSAFRNSNSYHGSGGMHDHHHEDRPPFPPPSPSHHHHHHHHSHTEQPRHHHHYPDNNDPLTHHKHHHHHHKHDDKDDPDHDHHHHHANNADDGGGGGRQGDAEEPHRHHHHHQQQQEDYRHHHHGDAEQNDNDDNGHSGGWDDSNDYGGDFTCGGDE